MVHPDDVVAVLLADGWHEVDRSSELGFKVVLHGFVGAEADSPGFLMAEVHAANALLTGPVSSILAVRYKRP